MSFILFKLPKNLEFQFNFSISGYGQKDRIILIAQPAIDTSGESTNHKICVHFLHQKKVRKTYCCFLSFMILRKKEIRIVGRLFVKSSGKPIDILSKLNEMAGFAPDEEEIELFEGDWLR
ncbi:hypothetical protein ACS0TY_022727 [Phlomoides rotata]